MDGYYYEGIQQKLNGNGQEITFIQVVGDIRNVELLFKCKVNDSDEDTMESEDQHCADGYDSDKRYFDAVETSAEVDDTIDGKEIDHIIEGDVQDEMVFVDMPVKKDDADEQGRETYKEIIPEVEVLLIVCMTEEIPHEEKAEAAYESMECDIGRKTPVFICAIKYDADDGKEEHNNLSIVIPIAKVSNPVHEEKCKQKPCDTI